MKLRLALTGALALALAGCDGGGSTPESAAPIVPDTATVFVRVDTDLASSQIKRGDAVLRKFPIRDRVLRAVRQAFASSGVRYGAVKRSVGPEVDIAVLDSAGTTVGFTQPVDEKAFKQALQTSKTHVATAKIRGWTAFAHTQDALDQVKHADEKLADAEAFKAATGALPDEALATAFVAGSAAREGVSTLGGQARTLDSLGVGRARWISAALTAHDDGIELQLHLNGKNASGGTPFDSTLADEAPAGALAAISFTDAGSVVAQLRKAGVPGLGEVERTLGTSLDDIARALADEGLIYVRRGTPIPEVTLVAREQNEQRARRTAGSIVRALTGGSGKTSTTTVDGVKLTAVDLGSLTVFYGTFAGKLVVTDNADAVRDLKSGGDKLRDDKLFKAAADAVGLPEKSNGWIYLDLKDAVPLVEGFAQLAGAQIPPAIDDNLRPLRTAIAYATREGDTQTVKLFVQTS